MSSGLEQYQIEIFYLVVDIIVVELVDQEVGCTYLLSKELEYNVLEGVLTI